MNQVFFGMITGRLLCFLLDDVGDNLVLWALPMTPPEQNAIKRRIHVHVSYDFKTYPFARIDDHKMNSQKIQNIAIV